MASRPTATVLLAFAVFTVLGGANAIGVKFVLLELPPFWAAALRFTAAGLLLGVLMVATRRPFPRGDRLVGTVLFGVFGFALAYLFIYWGLQDAPAGTTMLLLAIVPLLTLLLAVVQGVERMRPLGLVGAVVAAIGVLVVSANQVTLDVPIPALLALLAAAFCMAESGVVVKRFPPGDPVAANSVAMLIGAALLGAVALVTGESATLPEAAEVWVAMLYLVVPGSVLLFILVLYVLARWTASATSYAFLLFPIVAIGLGAALLQEPVQPTFLLGGAIVLVGVYLGAVFRPSRGSGAAATATGPTVAEVEPGNERPAEPMPAAPPGC